MDLRLIFMTILAVTNTISTGFPFFSNPCNQKGNSKEACLDTELCLTQPNVKQNVWTVCEWPSGHPIPTKVCCNINIGNGEKQIPQRPQRPLPPQEQSQLSKQPDIYPSGMSEKFCGRNFQLNEIPRNRPSRIVQGASVNLGKIPWMVSIYKKQTHEFVCGGTIINRRQVISAAHCFDEDLDPANYYLLVGSVLLNNGTIYSISKLSLHNKYFPPRIYHDISVLTVNGMIIFNNEVSPICIANEHMTGDRLNGATAFVAGFGDMEYLGQLAMGLQQVDLNIIANERCRGSYSNLPVALVKFPFGITNSLICAGHEDGGKDACQGDSGGPLQITINGLTYLIGIVSFGYKCGLPGFPGVYTSISDYLKWISRQ